MTQHFHITYTIDHTNVVCFCVSLTSLALYAKSSDVFYHVHIISSAQNDSQALVLKDYILIANTVSQNPNIKLHFQSLYFGDKAKLCKEFEQTLNSTIVHNPNNSFDDIVDAVINSYDSIYHPTLQKVITQQHLNNILNKNQQTQIELLITNFNNIDPKQLTFTQGKTLTTKSLELSYLKVFIPLVLQYYSFNVDFTLYIDLDAIFVEDPYKLFNPLTQVMVDNSYYVAGCKKLPLTSFIEPVRFTIKQYISFLEGFENCSLAQNYACNIIGCKTRYDFLDTGVMYLNLKQIKKDNLHSNFLLSATNRLDLPTEIFSDNHFREEDFFNYIFNKSKPNAILYIATKFNLDISDKEWLTYHNNTTQILDEYSVLKTDVPHDFSHLVPNYHLTPSDYVKGLPKVNGIIRVHNDTFPWLEYGKHFQNVFWWAAAYSFPFFKEIVQTFAQDKIITSDLAIIQLLNQYYFNAQSIGD